MSDPIGRDIKSMNCFLEEESTSGGIVARLGDFGETITLEEAADQVDVSGTVFWQAPEVLQNHKIWTDPEYIGVSCSCSSDCYGLATLLWECCSQQQPFHPTPLSEVTGRALHGVELVDRIIEGLRPEVLGCWDCEESHSQLRLIRLVVEQAWHGEPTTRPTAVAMNEVCQLVLHYITEAVSPSDSTIKPAMWSAPGTVRNAIHNSSS